MSTIDLNTVTLKSGLRLEVATRGHGPAILFLHGYTDSWRSFEPVMSRLPDDVMAVAISQRGHGESDRPLSGYGFPDLAGDAAAVLDALAIADAMVVGHSMGSMVAQELALSHPDRVSRLVLVDSTTRYGNPVTRELLREVCAQGDSIPYQFAWDFQASTVHRPVPEQLLRTAAGESMKLPARVWREVMASQIEHQTTDRVGAIAVPTLILWGDRDGIFPRSEQDLLHHSIPYATLLIYEDSGHAPHWEQPERVARHIVEFLPGRTAADRPAASYRR